MPVYRLTFEMFSDAPPPPEPSACEEIGQVSSANVSAHNRTRVHSVKVRPGEKRCLVANFNGAVPQSRRIVRAVWRMNAAYAASLSGGAITNDGRATEVLASAHYPGLESVECAATLDNGEVYVQVFVVDVARQAVWMAADLPQGSTQIVVTADD